MKKHKILDLTRGGNSNDIAHGSIFRVFAVPNATVVRPLLIRGAFYGYDPTVGYIINHRRPPEMTPILLLVRKCENLKNIGATGLRHSVKDAK